MEDVNRSWVGRAIGAIVLLWLASVAVGIPFKYGLAAALLAVSAVLFLDWDRARRSGHPGRAVAGSTMARPTPVSTFVFVCLCELRDLRGVHLKDTP